MISRRRFLQASAAAGASVWLGACSADAENAKATVVVVGAGLAGLVAATQLEAAGRRVIVLEARDRVGGRCHTWKFSGGQVAEAGGEFLDLDHRTMRALAKRHGLALEDLENVEDRTSPVYFEGKRQDFDKAFPAAVQAETDRFWNAVGSPRPALDRTTPAALLDRLGLSEDARYLVEENIRGDYTVEPDKLSLQFLALGQSIGEDLPESGYERFRIKGGNEQLPRALAAGLEDVRTGSPVTELHAGSRGVEAVTPRGRVRAHACVLAAPLPALRNVDFSPGLPASWAGAVAGLQYGGVSKTAVQYASRFWREAGTSGDLYTDLPVGEMWESTDLQGGRRGILMGYAVDRGEVGVQSVRGQLDQVYPGSAAGFERGRNVTWKEEPYTGGSYSAWAPGQVTKWWSALRRRHGRIVMAGEHTDDFSGYMEGAARSGRRAARQILQIA